jgi:hypothetical protein
MKLKDENTQNKQKTLFHSIQNKFQPTKSITIGVWDDFCTLNMS